jgi:hypothetical protein
MSSLVEKTGPATLVLLSVQSPAALPKTAELKRGFGCTQLKIYKRNGKFDYEIDYMTMVHEGRGSIQWVEQEILEAVTHVLALPYGPCEKLQALLTFGEIIKYGFTVDAASMKKLRHLTVAKHAALKVHETQAKVTEVLETAKDLALFVGITDGSLDAALERHLANIDPNYGSEIAAEILEREAKWLAAHTWRDCRDEQESAVNANSLENPVRHVQAA